MILENQDLDNLLLEPNLGATPVQSGPVEHGQRMYLNAPVARSSSEHKPTVKETESHV